MSHLPILAAFVSLSFLVTHPYLIYNSVLSFYSFSMQMFFFEPSFCCPLFSFSLSVFSMSYPFLSAIYLFISFPFYLSLKHFQSNQPPPPPSSPLHPFSLLHFPALLNYFIPAFTFHSTHSHFPSIRFPSLFFSLCLSLFFLLVSYSLPTSSTSSILLTTLPTSQFTPLIFEQNHAPKFSSSHPGRL